VWWDRLSAEGEEISHAFEVVVTGSIKEALYRLGKLPTNVEKFIVVDVFDDKGIWQSVKLLHAEWILGAAGSVDLTYNMRQQ
jgi:hypothetical protein